MTTQQAIDESAHERHKLILHALRHGKMTARDATGFWLHMPTEKLREYLSVAEVFVPMDMRGWYLATYRNSVPRSSTTDAPPTRNHALVREYARMSSDERFRFQTEEPERFEESKRAWIELGQPSPEEILTPTRTEFDRILNQFRAHLSTPPTPSKKETPMPTDQIELSREYASMLPRARAKLANDNPTRFEELRGAWYSMGCPEGTPTLPEWSHLTGRERAHIMDTDPARAQRLREEWFSLGCPMPDHFDSGPEAA